jgi:uncharacterized protein with von Willebrand factor type A (vWA) domain
MYLQLWLENKLVGKVQLVESEITNQLYIDYKKAELLAKYNSQVEASDTIPEFFIQAASKMNQVQQTPLIY